MVSTLGRRIFGLGAWSRRLKDALFLSRSGTTYHQRAILAITGRIQRWHIVPRFWSWVWSLHPAKILKNPCKDSSRKGFEILIEVRSGLKLLNYNAIC